MNTTGWKSLAIVLGLVCRPLVCALGVVGWELARVKIEIMFAAEQIGIFEDMRVKPLNSKSEKEIRQSLEYAEFYYPSGTKQRSGSRLDGIVERHRAAVLREIQSHLDQAEAR